MSETQSTARFGDRYFCIKSPLATDGEIYVMADALYVEPSGALMCMGHTVKHEPLPVLVLAPGQWTGAYAASLMGGIPVAIEHWTGELPE